MKSSIFFRDKAILSFMDKKTAQAMSKALSHIWRRAQTSMRYRKGASKPGQPPSAHKEHGAKIRNLMRFAFNPKEKRGVVGPLSGPSKGRYKLRFQRCPRCGLRP
jgi:hypothetical protein